VARSFTQLCQLLGIPHKYFTREQLMIWEQAQTTLLKLGMMDLAVLKREVSKKVCKYQANEKKGHEGR